VTDPRTTNDVREQFAENIYKSGIKFHNLLTYFMADLSISDTLVLKGTIHLIQIIFHSK